MEKRSGHNRGHWRGSLEKYRKELAGSKERQKSLVAGSRASAARPFPVRRILRRVSSSQPAMQPQGSES